MLRILTDRGIEYCGKAEQHDYELYLALNDIEHAKTKARYPQTNGICERFHETIFMLILSHCKKSWINGWQTNLEGKVYRLNST